MVNKSFFFPIFFIIMSFFLCARPRAENVTWGEYEDLKRIVVAPVKNETREKQFNKLLVMDGVRNLVAQAFYETGMFMPLESESEAKKNIEEFTGGNLTDANETLETLPHATVRPVIKKLKKSRTRTMLWGFSSATTRLQIEISLEIEDLDGTSRIVYGKGRAKMKSRGVLFQIRDDKINFDETGVGRALKQAVYDAVKRYISIISEDRDKKNAL